MTPLDPWVLAHPVLARLAVAAAGLVVAFRGYSTFRLALAFSGFVVGAATLASRPQLLPLRPDWLAPLLVLAAGVVAALVVLLAWRVGVFLVGALALLAIVPALPIPMPTEPAMRLVVLAAAALVGGLAARFLERFVLSIVTAAFGAGLVASALVSLGGRPLAALRPPHGEFRSEPWFVVAWIVLFVAGAAVQLSRGDGRSRDEG